MKRHVVQVSDDHLKFVLHQVPRTFLRRPEMLPSLRRVLRPAFCLAAGRGRAGAGLQHHPTPALALRCYLGTHPLKEPVEPLDSPQGAKEFIYSLHPSERTCLLRELHRFESIAIAQGE